MSFFISFTSPLPPWGAIVLGIELARSGKKQSGSHLSFVLLSLPCDFQSFCLLLNPDGSLSLGHSAFLMKDVKNSFYHVSTSDILFLFLRL